MGCKGFHEKQKLQLGLERRAEFEGSGMMGIILCTSSKTISDEFIEPFTFYLGFVATDIHL